HPALDREARMRCLRHLQDSVRAICTDRGRVECDGGRDVQKFSAHAGVSRSSRPTYCYYNRLQRREFVYPWRRSTPLELDLDTLIRGYAHGRRFQRKLTLTEREVLAVAGAGPERHLILPSPGLDRQGLSK